MKLFVDLNQNSESNDGEIKMVESNKKTCVYVSRDDRILNSEYLNQYLTLILTIMFYANI